MASKLFSFIGFSFLILLSLLSSPSHAEISPTTPLPPETICKSTPYPSSCISVLPKGNANVYDSGRFSIRQSLSQSNKFLKLVEKQLARSSTLSQPTIRALEDCKFLASQNVDFLSGCIGTVNKTSTVLPSLEADNVQTLLSSILTNLQTCLEGLQTTSSTGIVDNTVLDSLSSDSKLHSVSLAFFTNGWVPKQRDATTLQPKSHPTFRSGRLPLKMSDKTRRIYESALNRRKLLQGADEGVVIKDIVVVSKDGSGNFTNINDAIAVAPNNSAASDGYFLIYVTTGVYEEYVSIASNKKYLFILGDGIGQTIITGNRSVGDGWTTFNSATLAVVAQGFLAVGITIRNTAGPSKGQAVALRSGADLSTFYSCSFEGYQDTLYTHSQRQFFRECDIYGTVDFIFGNAAVVLQNCNIYPRLPLQGQSDPITAQGRTDLNQNTGTSIHNCTIKAAENLGSTKTYLGRPWKEYSRTVYMQTFMDSLINPAGWSAWSGDFALSTLYYAEYKNTGPGSNTSMRVTWPGYHVINATNAVNFTVASFLLGHNWLPQTGVPYTGGLI
ncbi:probable pectinesterase/pectinesterase inhibitor 7 [Ziziphus jujuba]|uniref:Pectinesterase n=1 Tax=Ziziphus jujuba TaxID=326968 RepID=A0A6P4ACQ6_ZIZJJ|nr:probable pectinesterase/pectinesterase inhibitor 7 [Ziziphus jujuba]